MDIYIIYWACVLQQTQKPIDFRVMEPEVLKC